MKYGRPNGINHFDQQRIVLLKIKFMKIFEEEFCMRQYILKKNAHGPLFVAGTYM